MHAFLTCRLLGHAWDEHSPIDQRRPEFGVAMHWRCIRCTMVRRDLVSSVTGDLLSRSYYQPEGYKMTAEERPRAIDLRLMAVKERGEPT